MAGFRSDRVAEQMKKEIASVIANDVRDPDVTVMCSVTEVEVTRDLRHAKVMVSIMGDDATQQKVLKALRKADGFIRSRLSQRMTLRYTPEVHFHLDKAIDYNIRINELIKSIEDNRSGEDVQPDQTDD